MAALDSPLRAISCFSGAGGMDIGVINAGFNVLAAIEVDEHCCATLQTNIERENRQTKVINEDIRNINAADLMCQFSLQPGQLDLLCGGPPCQSFSQIGKQKALQDDRGLLLFEMLRLAQAIQPKVILIEQVKGLINAKDADGNKGAVFAMLLSALEASGYAVKWKLVNAADYGVPQLRQRLFIIASRTATEFQFPKPSHMPKGVHQGLFALSEHTCIGDAIKELGDPGNKGSERTDSHIDVTPSGDKRRISGVPEGECLATQTHLPPEQIGKLTKKDTTKYLRLSRSKPANTLRCGEIFFHPTEDRYLTPRECMRIHGYSDSYIFRGPIRGRSGSVKNLDQHRQVANSVPPPIAKIIATAIKDSLECQRYLKHLAIA